jgi:hypothetical protein
MLDYEISYYKVLYRRWAFGKLKRCSRSFDTEEDAVEFVKEHRTEWQEYRIEQVRSAIIDF